MSRRGVFLDLNGTLVEPLKQERLDELTLIPGVAEAVARLTTAGFVCPVVTVQSRIAKGLFSMADFRTWFAAFAAGLEARGALVVGPYICPHRYAEPCPCKKVARPTRTAIFKLTQKLQARANGAQQGLITNIYLTEGEFRLLAQLPAKMLSKVRYSVPPFGIDVFEGTLQGLRLAEAEFDSAAEADVLIVPGFILHEVTDDERFTGGQLVCASPSSVEKWLAEYGIALSDPHPLRHPEGGGSSYSRQSI